MSKYLSYPFFYLLLSTATTSMAENADSETSLSVRFAYYDRNFSRDSRDRTQTGTGVILGHSYRALNDTIVLNAAAHTAQHWRSSGLQTEDLFAQGSRGLRSFSLLGEANIAVKPSSDITIKLGRFKHKSLLLKSKMRVLPSTFQGVGFTWQPTSKSSVYAYRFNKWSRRADDRFLNFSTEATDIRNSGKVGYVDIVGAKIQHSHSAFTVEHLHSANFLSKLGLLASTKYPLSKYISINGKGGLFTSRDAGPLFVDGANSTLDRSLKPSQYTHQGIDQRIRHRGIGGFASLSLLYKSATEHSLTLAHTRIGDPWLEDNFAEDHGTSPFPSSTIGPELTNKDERLWLLKYNAKINHGRFSGLATTLSTVNGYGASNSNGREFGSASENWFDIDIRYQYPAIKNLNARLRYRDYRSLESGSIAGVKRDRSELRFTLDYSTSF